MKPMTKQKKKYLWFKQKLRPLVVLGAILFAVYLLFLYLIMPLYTRHWQRIKVPDVVDMSFRTAAKVIDSNHLEAVQGELKYDEMKPPGFVIFQQPAGGSFVKKGRRIYLNVSKGKIPMVMPDLVGVPLRDARFSLVQSQLSLGDIEYEFDAYYPQDVVIEQSIDSGTEIQTGRRIDLVVSLGEETQDIFVPNLVGKSMNEAQLLIKKSMLYLDSIEYQQSKKSPAGHVLWQSLIAGESAAKGDTLSIVVTQWPRGEEESIPW